MRAPSRLLSRIRRIAIWVSLDLLLATALLGLTVWADSPSKVRDATVPICYCGCAASKVSAGCGKMCELSKYASRRWAVTCSKPRATTPTENPGAGPRLPRPGRAERASN
jgi:hypothetical protein